jgi:excisionase family DNA binding protein
MFGTAGVPVSEALTASLEQTVNAIADLIAERVAEQLQSQLAAPPAEAWRLVSVDEIANILGRSKRWVHGAVKERGLPYIRLDGGALAFSIEDVRAWAEARRVPRREEGEVLEGVLLEAGASATKTPALATRLQSTRKPASHAASSDRARIGMQKVDAQ